MQSTIPEVDRPAAKANAWQGWQLRGLRLEPEEEWRRMREFVRLSDEDLKAVMEMIEPLVEHENELVAEIFEHLQRDDEMSLILGWENGVDPRALAEKRRFLTIWLSRTLGLGLSGEFAHFLFDAGRKYAGHGLGQVRIPERYVVGMMNLIYTGFMRTLMKERAVDEVMCAALLGWSKMLNMQTTLVLAGYHAACDVSQGDFPVKVSFYGDLRESAGRSDLEICVNEGSRVETLLKKLFNYLPQLRREVFDARWVEKDRDYDVRTPTLILQKVYTPREPIQRRMVLNGRDLAYSDGPAAVLSAGDQIGIY